MTASVIKSANTLAVRIAFLQDSSIFSGSSEDEIKKLAGMSNTCHFRKGDVIYTQGDSPDYIYVFHSGRIKYFSMTVTGKTVIARFTNGTDLGGIANLFAGDPRWLTAQAMEDIQALRIPRQNFLEFVRSNPGLALKIQGLMEQFLHGLFNRFKAAVVSPAEQRVVDVLYELCEKFGTALPFRDEDIANVVGITRETTVRAMRRLRVMGIVRSKKSLITIVDLERLRSLTEEYPVI
jgi:CRP-like cAMP-binding protein